MHAIVVSCYPVTWGGLGVLLGNLLASPEIETVSSLQEVLVSATNKPIDLMLIEMDSGVPDMAEIKGAVDAVRPAPVVLFALLSASDVQAAFDGGVRGCVPKTAPPDLFAAALRLILAGGVYFSDLAQAAPPPIAQPGLRVRFSTRQLEVMRLVEIGQTNKEIAQALGISVATVKLHVQAILHVTGARNRTEASLRARGHIR